MKNLRKVKYLKAIFSTEFRNKYDLLKQGEGVDTCFRNYNNYIKIHCNRSDKRI